MKHYKTLCIFTTFTFHLILDSMLFHHACNKNVENTALNRTLFVAYFSLSLHLSAGPSQSAPRPAAGMPAHIGSEPASSAAAAAAAREEELVRVRAVSRSLSVGLHTTGWAALCPMHRADLDTLDRARVHSWLL